MKTVEYKILFNTPAFLGNAQQDGQWRTPPIKAQLRQWWRMAYAANSGFTVNVNAMRHLEGLTFGHAWLDDDRNARGDVVAARRSRVRLRLDRWDAGRLRQWPQPDQGVRHPEVTNRQGQAVAVGSNLYLGYGPLTFQAGAGTALKKNAAIQAGEDAVLALAMPVEDAPTIEQALGLMDRYGALGGRSRNGWGSFSLTPSAAATPAAMSQPALRPWTDCLGLDWPHALGRDSQGPLIWQTQPFNDWRGVMKRLAEIKIGLRTHFTFNSGHNAQAPEARHWLSYPVTNHSVKAWGGNSRLPNTLRFKVRTLVDGKLVGVIFHIPHLPPAGFNPDRRAVETVWRQVHLYLDQPSSRLKRIAE